jgi:hypothetical protein
MSRWFDDRRNNMPDALRNVPPQVLVAVPVAVIGLLLGVGLVSALTNNDASSKATTAGAASAPLATPEGTPSPSTETTAEQAKAIKSAPKRATEAELTTATERGLVALRQLAKRYDQDASVAIAISAAHLKKRDFKSAVDAIARALTLEPSLRRDKQVSSVLWVASQNRASTDAAFVLLEGPMEERGLEILRDLATTAGVRADVKKRADEALARLR